MNGKVHNYYESRVFDEIERRIESDRLELDQDQFDDAACIALNQLPPRYVRFDIDTTFYASPEEIHQMTVAVQNAVTYAIQKVLANN